MIRSLIYKSEVRTYSVVVAVSKGKTELDEEDWNRVKEMEQERRRNRTAPPR